MYSMRVSRELSETNFISYEFSVFDQMCNN